MQCLWKTVWGFLRKLKIGLPFDSGTPLGYISEENKSNFFITQWIYYIYSCTMIMTIQFYMISTPQPQNIPLTLKLSPLETKSFSKSVSQYLFCKEVHFVLFWFHLSVKAFDIGVSLSDWLHLAWYESNYLKRYTHPNVYSSIIYNSQDMEADQVFINRLMNKKIWYLYIQWDIIYLSKKNSVICSKWIDLESITLLR